MSERTVTHATFVIERNYAASPEPVFAAFADPAKKRRWFAEREGLVGFETDFRVGGHEVTRSRMGAQTPFPGVELTNHTVYLDIVPDERLVLGYTMALAERRFSASLATIELVAEGEGTRLIFTEQAAFFAGSDGAQTREDGWRKLLEALAQEC